MIDEIKKEDVKEEKEKIPMRQIIIETDGNMVNLTKAEVSGKIELFAIFQTVIDHIKQQK